MWGESDHEEPNHDLAQLGGYYESTIGKVQTNLTTYLFSRVNILALSNGNFRLLLDLGAVTGTMNYGTQCTPDLSIISAAGKEPMHSLG